MLVQDDFPPEQSLYDHVQLTTQKPFHLETLQHINMFITQKPGLKQCVVLLFIAERVYY
jgi:hypothetical protein